MQTGSDGRMAIPHMFNSNTLPGAELSFLCDELGCRGCKEEKAEAIAPRLSRVMQHGTAKHVATAGPQASDEDPCVCIVAQAESKTTADNNDVVVSVKQLDI